MDLSSCLICKKNEYHLLIGSDLVQKIIECHFGEEFHAMLSISKFCIKCIGRLEQLNEFCAFTKLESANELIKEDDCDRSWCIMCRQFLNQYRMIPKENIYTFHDQLNRATFEQSLNFEKEVSCCFACFNFIVTFNEFKELLDKSNAQFFNYVNNCTIMLEPYESIANEVELMDPLDIGRESFFERLSLTPISDIPHSTPKKVTFAAEISIIDNHGQSFSAPLSEALKQMELSEDICEQTEFDPFLEQKLFYNIKECSVCVERLLLNVTDDGDEDEDDVPTKKKQTSPKSTEQQVKEIPNGVPNGDENVASAKKKRIGPKKLHPKKNKPEVEKEGVFLIKLKQTKRRNAEKQQQLTEIPDNEDVVLTKKKHIRRKSAEKPQQVAENSKDDEFVIFKKMLNRRKSTEKSQQVAVTPESGNGDALQTINMRTRQKSAEKSKRVAVTTEDDSVDIIPAKKMRMRQKSAEKPQQETLENGSEDIFPARKMRTCRKSADKTPQVPEMPEDEDFIIIKKIRNKKKSAEKPQQETVISESNGEVPAIEMGIRLAESPQEGTVKMMTPEDDNEVDVPAIKMCIIRTENPEQEKSHYVIKSPEKVDKEKSPGTKIKLNAKSQMKKRKRKSSYKEQESTETTDTSELTTSIQSNTSCNSTINQSPNHEQNNNVNKMSNAKTSMDNSDLEISVPIRNLRYNHDSVIECRNLSVVLQDVKKTSEASNSIDVAVIDRPSCSSVPRPSNRNHDEAEIECQVPQESENVSYLSESVEIEFLHPEYKNRGTKN